MRYRLLIFDWDGTLIDSIGSIVACAQATLAELGLPQIETKTMRETIGLGIRETVEVLHPGCDDETFGRITSVYRRLWRGHYGLGPRLFTGVEDLLTDLSAEGRLLAVATAKSRAGLENDWRRTGIGERFIASRTVDESKSKPDPEMILSLLTELETAPHEALMIGDSVHDLGMAANAGVDAVAVTTGSYPREALEALAPEGCLDGVTGLRAWLGSTLSAATERR